MKITDLMDLYEDERQPFGEPWREGARSDPPSADRGEAAGKETTEVKQRTRRFGWREGLSLAAALVFVVLGGFGVKRLMDRSGSSVQPGQNSSSSTEAFASTAPRPTGFDPVPEQESREMTRLLTALARQNVTDPARDLDEEYELVSFARQYLKLQGEEAGSIAEKDGYEALTLEQVNETLGRLLGKTVSPAEGTDYSALRGDVGPLRESFHDGCFWFPAAEGDRSTRFAVIGSVRDAGDWGWELGFELFDANLVRWPEFPAWDQISDLDITGLQEAGKIRRLGAGTARLLKTDDGLRLGDYRLEGGARPEENTGNTEPTYSVDPTSVNALLSAFAEQGITDSELDLAGEYELAQFAHIWTKLHNCDAISYQTEDGESYETLTLEQVNETLTGLMGKTVSPAEGTDYSVLRGDNYAQHESFRDGRFWWPAADGDMRLDFAIYNDRDSCLAAKGSEELELVLLRVVPELWPEWEQTVLTGLCMESLQPLLDAGKLLLWGRGRALIHWEGPEPVLDSYHLDQINYSVIQGESLSPVDTELPTEKPALGPEDPALKAELQALFSDPGSWYARALSSSFADPADVDLYLFFYDGLPGGDRLSNEELHEMYSEDAFDEDGDFRGPPTDRMARAELDKVLKQIFGLGLEDSSKRGLDGFGYLEESDCYYHCHGDTNMEERRITAARRMEDGTVLFTYEDGFWNDLTDGCYPALHTAALRPDGAGNYLVISNLPGEWVTAEDVGELSALFPLSGVLRAETRDADGTVTVRELDFGMDGEFHYREGDPNSEFSNWTWGKWWIGEDRSFRCALCETSESGNRFSPWRSVSFSCTYQNGELVLTQQSETGFAEDAPGTELRFAPTAE